MAGEILPDKLYTVEEVAEFLGGVHRRTVWRMLRRGEVRGAHIGRRWFVRGRDLLAAYEAMAEQAAGLGGEEPKPPDKPKGGKGDKGGELVLRKQEPRAKPKRRAKRRSEPPSKAKASVMPRVIG